MGSVNSNIFEGSSKNKNYFLNIVLIDAWTNIILIFMTYHA